jgi:hypothetical protein
VATRQTRRTEEKWVTNPPEKRCVYSCLSFTEGLGAALEKEVQPYRGLPLMLRARWRGGHTSSGSQTFNDLSEELV